MKSLYEYKTVVWVDLVEPTDAEVEEVKREYGIHQEIANDIISPSPRHTVSFYETHAYMVLHFPAFRTFMADAAYELDFIIGKDFVVTVHYEELEPLRKFRLLLDVDNVELPHQSENPRDIVLFGLLYQLILDFDRQLVDIDHRVRDLEQKMFSGKEKQTIFDISEASRHLIDFKKITAVYPESFQVLRDKGQAIFGNEFAVCTRDLIEFFERLEVKLSTLSDAVRELRDTNDAILSTKQNEAIRILSVVAVIVSIMVGIALVWVGLLAVR